MKMRIVSLLGWLTIRALHATLRVRHVDAHHIETPPQYILSFWHAHLLLMLHSRFRKPIAVMSSRSKDGDYAVGVYAMYGVETARGSSTRGGGSALREFLRMARNGRNIVFTPDGPKGPPRIAKDGIVYAARLTGLPIVPIAFAAKKKSCCAPGTAWSCRTRSRARSSSMVFRSTCRVTRTSRSGA
jgi:lysophospholipid acyltransferase (LPLAT)-like uncharacterized protein